MVWPLLAIAGTSVLSGFMQQKREQPPTSAYTGER